MPLNGPSLSEPADLTDLLAPSVTANPEQTALVSAVGAWTWGELDKQIKSLAARFSAIGLKPGARVASLMPNRPELLLHYLACLKAGLVVTPLNYRYTPKEIDYALNASGASVLLAHVERAADVRTSALAGKLPLGLIAFGGPLEHATRFESLIDREALNDAFLQPDRTAPALLFFTSGSTGKPKGVTHSLLSFGSIVASFAQAIGLTKRDVVLPGSSMSHVGAIALSLAGLSVGARVGVARHFDSDELLPLFRELRPSVFLTLPSALIALQRDNRATREDFRSLRLCLTSGDKFPASLQQEFTDQTGQIIKQVYGLTEATNCLFDDSDGTAKAGSSGVVSPGYMASLRDDSGREVPPDVDGNLWLKGTPVMLGYWNHPEATKAAIVDGWFDTGDVMRVDADGYFWFRGRKKQIIVHDGSNISPQEIEEVIMAHPAIDLAGVVGVCDEVHGENVWAYVTARDGVERPAALDIIRFTRERVGYKAPEEVILLDEMPINATGKVDRMTLKRWAAEQISAKYPG